MESIYIIGSGSWGVALSNYLDKNKKGRIILCPGRKKSFDRLKKLKYNNSLSEGVEIIDSIKSGINKKDAVIIAVSSSYVREVSKHLSNTLNNNIIISATKGIENDTFYTMSEVISSEIKSSRIAVISGPTIAKELQADYPATLVVASKNIEAQSFASDLFESEQIKVITEMDTRSVEVSGAIKNIVAIASGLCDSLRFGCNQKAAVMVGIIEELEKTFKYLNVSKRIFFGISGLGDILATANSNNSRNYKMGFFIGQGLTKAEAKKEIGMCVEGIDAIATMKKLGDKLNVELPIISLMHEIIENQIETKRFRGIR